MSWKSTRTQVIQILLEGGLLIFKFSRTLFSTEAGLEHAKQLVSSYKQGKIQSMTPELWEAKKLIDSTLHPGMSSILFR